MDPKALPGTLAMLQGQNPNNPILAPMAQPQPTAQDSATRPANDDQSDVPNMVNEPRPDPTRTTIGDVHGNKLAAFRAGLMKSPHVTSIANAVTQTIAENPQAAAQPGGVLRAIVAGGIQALGGGQQPSDDTTPAQPKPLTPGENISRGIASGLGDAAAATAPVPKGGGALSGALRTLGARNERLAREQKEATMMAEANVRMMHEQRLIHKMDVDAQNESVASGQRQIEMYRTQPSPAPVLGKSLTSDEITTFIKDKKMDPAKETAIPDGMKVIGTDKNGNPIRRMTYTLMGVPPDVKLDPTDPKQKAILDELNTYNPPKNGGKWGDGGPQTFTGTEFNLAMQHAADTRAMNLARDAGLVEAGVKENEIKRTRESLDFQATPEMVNALSHAPNGDIMKARDAMLKDPNIVQKYPNLDNDIRQWVDAAGGKGSYDKMLQKYQDKIEAGGNLIIDMQKKVDSAHGEEAAAMEKNIDAMIADPATDPGNLPRLRYMKNQAAAAAKASLDYDAEKEKQKLAQQNALDMDDVPQLVSMASAYKLDPDKLYTMRKNQKAAFIAELGRRDPNWSEAQYKQRYSMQQELASDKSNSMGGQVESLNRFGLHLASANVDIQGLRNSQFPLANKAINSIKKGAVGFEEANAFMIKAEAVKSEYLNFINNGHVPPTEEETRLAGLINRDQTPAEMQSTMRSMAHIVAGRGYAINGRYQTIMGTKDAIPGLLQPNTKVILRQFGINPDSITDSQSVNELGQTPGQAKAEIDRIAKLGPAPKGTQYLKDPKTGNIAAVPEANVPAALQAGAVAVQTK
ncbi:Uncharacterised protein [uncultured archaeon]|nr:Uncharacterised protein [uncultured archaeon]